MINFHNQVPSVYVNASRDFQYLSWLINIVLNSVKHNVDDMYDLPVNAADARISELLAFTLGFKVKRNYDKTQLVALTKALPDILRHKGTPKAVLMAGYALINVSGSVGECKCKIVDGVLEILLPQELVDITLFVDILPYILPAGLACKIVKKTQRTIDAATPYDLSDVIRAKFYKDTDLDDSGIVRSGYGGMYDYGIKDPSFSNFIYDENTKEWKLNPGVLDTTIIPALDTGLVVPGNHKVSNFDVSINESSVAITDDDLIIEANPAAVTQDVINTTDKTAAIN